MVEKYVKATKADDLSVLKELYFPPSLLCEDNSIPSDDALKRRIKKNIPDDYQVSVENYEVKTEPSILEKTLGIEAITVYSVEPTHKLKIGFEKYYENKEWPNQGASIQYHRIIKDKERWYFVLECPGLGYQNFIDLKKEHDS